MYPMTKRKRSARRANVVLACPRCGQKRSVAAIQTEHLILCPKCGAGMREVQGG